MEKSMSVSFTTSSRGRRRAAKKDSCFVYNIYNTCSTKNNTLTSSTVAGPLRRCFSEADSNIGQCRASEDTNDSHTSSSTAAENDHSSSSPISQELQESFDRPPTPGSNLRVLLGALSPELRKLDGDQSKEIQIDADVKRELFSDTSKNSFSEVNLRDIDTDTTELGDIVRDIVVVYPDADKTLIMGGSRKEKSLGLLCQK